MMMFYAEPHVSSIILRRPAWFTHRHLSLLIKKIRALHNGINLQFSVKRAARERIKRALEAGKQQVP
jgi:hypothetical protein